VRADDSIARMATELEEEDAEGSAADLLHPLMLVRVAVRALARGSALS
jgi:hypothetical protein